MTYLQAVRYISGIPMFSGKSRPEDTSAFYSFLGRPGEEQKIVHIAGTNGKGSVCAYLSSVLRHAGYSTAVFTSPHLVDIRERMVVNGEKISETEFLGCFEQVLEAVRAFAARENNGYHPSFFEFLFFMAMLWFKNKGTEFIVLETGLGGRLDATNTVNQKLITIITSIGCDHMEYLGYTREAIALEKAGIIREGVPVIFDASDSSISDVIGEYADRHRAPRFEVHPGDAKALSKSKKSIDFSYFYHYYKCIRVCLNTRARYQIVNSMLAVRAALELGIGAEEIEKGVREAFWPGRMEEIEPGLVIDGAHNADGIRSFLESVSEDETQGRRSLLLGAVSDKQLSHITELIAESRLFYRVYTTALESCRSADPQVLAEGLEKAGQDNIKVFDSVRDALAELRECRAEDDMIYAAGSLYMAGEIEALVGDIR